MKSAFLMLDLQNEMVDEKGFFGGMGLAKVVRERRVLENSAAVLDAARRHDITPVFVRLGFRPDYADALSVAPRVAKFKAAHAVVAGTWGTEFPDILKPSKDDMVFTKQAVNPFFNTGLLSWLMQRQITHLVVAGVVTNSAVEATARYADDAGFTTTVLEDCCAGGNMDHHRFTVDNILPMFCTISSSSAFIASLPKA
jgi:nicotinamidase-related amidase